MNINVAVCEDNHQMADTLRSYLLKFGEENGHVITVSVFYDALSLLDDYSADYGIIFMDIEMPFLNGMDAAKKLRKIDNSVLLIFVTNLAQYAVAGYEVDALDYILKPVSYFDFAMKLSRAVTRLPQGDSTAVVISTSIGSVRLDAADIIYAEVQGHQLVYHTQGQEYRQYGTMGKAEQQLAHQGFCRCNNCYLVNLSMVRCIKGYNLEMKDGTELKISQPKKKAFMQALEEFSKK